MIHTIGFRVTGGILQHTCSPQDVTGMMASNDFMLMLLSFVRSETGCSVNYKSVGTLLTLLKPPAGPCSSTAEPCVKAF